MIDVGSKAISRTHWLVSRALKQVWVRASLFSVAAVVVALLAAFIGPYIPYDPSLTLASGSVGRILNILATSMLAVTTFSLSIMISAYAAATSNATPRSTKLLLADSIAQNTLSTFVGTFLFSVVGIIGIAAGLYEGKGRVLLFIATLFVLAIVVVALLRWIEQLGHFGRVGDTIERVEKATLTALVNAGREPSFGAGPPMPIPKESTPIFSAESGHVQHIDYDRLQEIADEMDRVIHIALLPGALVGPARPLAHVHPAVQGECCDRIREGFSIGNSREFDHDPRFGLIVLSEIASRALSPAVNDPGTAIEVADAAMRLFLAFGDAKTRRAEPRCPALHGPEVDVAELMDCFFNPVSRDGAATLELQSRLIAVLRGLAEAYPSHFTEEARRHADRIIARSELAMVLPADRKELAQRARSLRESR